jgi:hypothetical protein
MVLHQASMQCNRILTIVLGTIPMEPDNASISIFCRLRPRIHLHLIESRLDFLLHPAENHVQIQCFSGETMCNTIWDQLVRPSPSVNPMGLCNGLSRLPIFNLGPWTRPISSPGLHERHRSAKGQDAVLPRGRYEAKIMYTS